MTTLNSNMLAGNTIDISAHSGSNTIYIEDINYETPTEGISVPREEFASAVRDLGFVVIEKAERAVYESETHYEVGHQTYRKDVHTATSARVAGEELLALSAHLEANPPIDPKVKALESAIRMSSVITSDAKALARELIASKIVDVRA